MGILEKIAMKFGTKYIAIALIAIKAFLEGKKTYAGAVVGIIGAIIGYYNGDISLEAAAAGIWFSFMMIFRAASSARALKNKPSIIVNMIQPPVINTPE